MAITTVLADPPIEGFVLSDLVDSTPLTSAEAADLYEALLVDVCRTVEGSGADLLVNYRPTDHLPDEYREGVDPERRLRETVKDGLEDPEAARFEVQVGSSFSARVGNTVTHLLEREDASSVAVVEPTAALLPRTAMDTGGMKLRTNDVVLGPTVEGRVHYAAFGQPIDFTDAFASPALETLTTKARTEGLDVDFLPMQPVFETGADLLTAVPVLWTRQQAGQPIPERTFDLLDELGLRVSRDGDTPTLVRE
jgi:hypothetical protein